MPGRPDFQTVDQQSSTTVVSQVGISFPTGFTLLYAGPASSWASLLCRFTAVTGAARVTLTWFADVARTEQIGRDVFLINNNTGAEFRYPVKGPVLTIDLQNDAGAAQVMTIWVSATQSPADGTTYTVQAQQAGQLSRVYNLSETANFFPGFLLSGMATLTFNPFDTTGKLLVAVFVTDQFGTNVRRLAYLPAATVPTSVSFAVPDQPLKLTVVNTDGAATHEADVSLVVPVQ